LNNEDDYVDINDVYNHFHYLIFDDNMNKYLMLLLYNVIIYVQKVYQLLKKDDHIYYILNYCLMMLYEYENDDQVEYEM